MEKTLNNNTLKILLSDNEYQRILGLQLKQVAPVENSDEVLKYCPQCDYGEFIHPKAERFNCLICNVKMCPSCNSEPPHPGMTCRQFREYQAN
jgi:predicted nucleic-acid-binding Zn-ribbon protein